MSLHWPTLIRACSVLQHEDFRTIIVFGPLSKHLSYAGKEWQELHDRQVFLSITYGSRCVEGASQCRQESSSYIEKT